MLSEISSARVALIDRLLCLVVITSIQLFTTAEFYSIFPFDHRVLVAKVLVEIVACLALLRISDGAVVRDCIDLTLYAVLIRSIILLAWFFNPELYVRFGQGITFVITNGLFLAGFARLIWGYPQNGHFKPKEWPIIGAYGLEWKRKYGDQAASAAGYFRVIATLAICMEIAAILLSFNSTVYQYIPGAVGLTLVFLYASPIRQDVVETERDLADQADLLEKYEDIIEQVAGRVKADNSTDPANGRDEAGPTAEKSKLRLVKDEQEEP